VGRKVIDLTGQRFGKLVVLEGGKERNKHGQIQWKCRCDCGEVKEVTGAKLRSGHIKSCGCLRVLDIKGEKFGSLTPIKPTDRRVSKGTVIWECLCDCGETSFVASSNLRSGNTLSCGCSRYRDVTGMKFGRLTALTRIKKEGTTHVYWRCKCNCGIITEVSLRELRSGGTRSCGCLQAEKARETLEKVRPLLTGEKHWNYNPEISDEQRMDNRYQLHGISMANWRKEIFNSDDYVCQGCGKRGYSLNAHHLNAWNAFPEQRFDTANGITLCEDCHKEYHHFNGYGDNTLEQFRDHIACTVGEEHVLEIEEALLSRESEIIGQEEVAQKETRELQTT
jgi:5-methylcytosine-specific restriction endonuclease McrA